MLARRTFSLGVVFAMLGVAPEARAKAVHESPYTYEQTFGSTLRLLKVDLDVEVTETNADWGYLVFNYTSSESGKRKNRGSFTFVKNQEGIQVALQIPEMPSYHEQIIIDKLKRKLASEHGDPPPREKPKKPDDKDKDEDDKSDEDKDDASD